MPSLKRPSIDRRGFLVTMSATALAAGGFALLTGRASAAPASFGAEQLSVEGRPITHEINRSIRNEGVHEMMTQSTVASAQSLPTIVMVHGAFAESASWNSVAAKLLSQGYSVVAVANPLRGVKTDAAYVAGLLKTITGPVVLVGHSYGGMVISNAVASNGNVVGLVFVAGFAPDAGETAGELAGKFPGSTLGATLTPPITLPDGGSDLYIQQDKFWVQFAADLPESDANVMAATQRPIVAAAFTEPSGAPAWKTVPSWFVYGELDKNIPAAAHAFMAERAGSRGTTEVKGASHVVMVSHPETVVSAIVSAAVAHTPAGAAA